jgi:hypothetical protein
MQRALMLRWCAVSAALILLAGAGLASLASAARADEPGSGRVSGARTSKELPRWPLASLASAAGASASDAGAADLAPAARPLRTRCAILSCCPIVARAFGGADNGEILESRPVRHRGG